MAKGRIPGPICRENITIDDGTLCLNESPLPGPIGWPTNKNRELENALDFLKIEAINFAIRFTKDEKVRKNYIRNADFIAKAIEDEVITRRLTPHEGALEANTLRNFILQTARLASSDIGLAAAEHLKRGGKSLAELEERYAQDLYRQSFEKLAVKERNSVWLKIIERSGGPRPEVNCKALFLGRLGRGFMVASAGIAVYNVATAADKPRQVAQEGATVGAGIVGGMGGGAVAGLLCGPASPLCVGVGVFVGGALSALGMDLAFDWAW